MDVNTTTNQSLTGEEIVQPEDAGREVVQLEDAGREIVQPEDDGKEIIELKDAGKQIGQAEDAGKQIGQAENAGKQIGQAEDAGKQIGQAEDARKQAGQSENTVDISHLSFVELSTESGGACLVYIIGVTHHTQESCNSVRSVIEKIKPKVVFLELCDSRLEYILGEHMPVTTWKDVLWATITGKILIMIVMWFLSKMVADIDARESEFKVAYEEAKKLNSVVIAGDIPIEITYERIWKATSLKQKKLIVRNYREVYAGDEKEMENLYHACPFLYKILVEDRDRYMTLYLRQLSNKYPSMLAVVGKDHVKGIHKNLTENIEIIWDELIEEIVGSIKLSYVKIVASAGIVSILLIGCYFWKKN